MACHNPVSYLAMSLSCYLWQSLSHCIKAQCGPSEKTAEWIRRRYVIRRGYDLALRQVELRCLNRKKTLPYVCVPTGGKCRTKGCSTTIRNIWSRRAGYQAERGQKWQQAPLQWVLQWLFQPALCIATFNTVPGSWGILLGCTTSKFPLYGRGFCNKNFPWLFFGLCYPATPYNDSSGYCAIVKLLWVFFIYIMI